MHHHLILRHGVHSIAAHQDNVGDRYDDEAAGEQGAEVGADPLGGVHLLGDPLEVFLVLGHCVQVVADDGAEARVDVEDGLLEGQGVAVHVALPLARPQPAEQQEAVLLLGRHLGRLLGETHRLELVGLRQRLVRHCGVRPRLGPGHVQAKSTN